MAEGQQFPSTAPLGNPVHPTPSLPSLLQHLLPLLLLNGPAIVGHPRGREIGTVLPATRLLGLRPVLQCPPFLQCLSTETSALSSPAAAVIAAPVPDAAPLETVPDNSPVTVPVPSQLPAKETTSPVMNIESMKLKPAPKPPAYLPGTQCSRANFSSPWNAPLLLLVNKG